MIFPKKIKTYNGINSKAAKQKLIDKFQYGNVIKLKETEFKQNKFRLVKSVNFWNPFTIKIILGEIEGQIEENQTTCEIGLSPLMKMVVYIDTILLFIISLGLLFSYKFDGFIAISIFIIVMISFFYFRLKSEIRILESYIDETFGK